jgi:hypothetical protein
MFAQNRYQVVCIETQVSKSRVTGTHLRAYGKSGGAGRGNRAMVILRSRVIPGVCDTVQRYRTGSRRNC